MEHKIPPPIVAIVTAALMWVVARATPSLAFVLPARSAIAGGVALAGVCIAVLGVATFRRARTTITPLHPERATSLVTTAIYRRTRNPMYLGLLLVLIGWAIFLSNALSLIFLPAFILYITRFQIMPEEAALESIFKQEFTSYKSRVRRWV